MMNYKVYPKTKRICANLSELTKEEKEIVSFYIASGYILAPKKKGTVKGDRLNLATIIHFFYTNNDTKGADKFYQEYNSKKPDKNGVMRKGGFLAARKWFKQNYSVVDLETVDTLTKAEVIFLAKWDSKKAEELKNEFQL